MNVWGGGGGGGKVVSWNTESCTFFGSPKAVVPCSNSISLDTIS